jgi:His Kinase A (phospho-acceptor) domain
MFSCLISALLWICETRCSGVHKPNCIEAERMSAIGRMACSISHDMRHSLTAIYANAEFLERHDRSASARAELLFEIQEAVLAMTERIDSLLQFGSSGLINPLVHVRVSLVVEKAVAAVRCHPDGRNMSITVGKFPPADFTARARDLPPNTRTTTTTPRKVSGAFCISTYAACFFCFAHRALCASAIRLRPAADMVRFFTSVGLGLLVDPGGLPRLRGLLVPAKSARACCSRAISSSMLFRSALISIRPLYSIVRAENRSEGSPSTRQGYKRGRIRLMS